MKRYSNEMVKERKNRMRTKILKIYGGFLFVGIIYFIWIQATNIYIPCFYFLTTGLLCPGCGTTRMFLSLIQLDFAGAFAHNPVAFLLFFVWNLIALLSFWGKPSFVKQGRFLYGVFAVSVIILWGFGVVRNLY